MPRPAPKGGRGASLTGDRCDFCDSGRLRGGRVREEVRVGEGLVVMDGVPAHVCEGCGERYYDADVVKRFDLVGFRRLRMLA